MRGEMHKKYQHDLGKHIKHGRTIMKLMLGKNKFEWNSDDIYENNNESSGSIKAENLSPTFLKCPTPWVSLVSQILSLIYPVN
jgi:hypothetical protein